MYPFMDFQGRSLSKSFIAKLTDVRFFTVMRALMLAQVILFGERFTAVVTSVRLIASMNTQMKLELFSVG